MLKIKKFEFNPFSENTYLVYDEENNSVIIDPGCYYPHEEQELNNFIISNKLTVNAILHTHSHLDHMFGTAYFAKKFKLNVFIHSKDEITYNSFQKVCSMYGIPVKLDAISTVNYFDLSKGFQIGKHHLEIRFVPGHSPGHVVFYSQENNFVINGDCLFQGSIGRTDLPGGDHNKLISSIKDQLFTLPDDTLVYCGHGPETTIIQEKLTNPFLG